MLNKGSHYHEQSESDNSSFAALIEIFKRIGLHALSLKFVKSLEHMDKLV